MTSVSELHKKWMAKPAYAEAYGELETEFAGHDAERPRPADTMGLEPACSEAQIRPEL